MREGARLGWIDGMLIAYNYRVQYKEKMIKAVAACARSGIGLTAMKTQAPAALGHATTETKKALEMAEQFHESGFSPEQARLKAVWENPHIASICSQMDNMAILSAYVAAALDPAKLSTGGMRLLQQYASETKSQYCTGCSRICHSAVSEAVPVSDLMRYLMYSRSYGDHQLARSLFKKIPGDIRHRIARVDYTEAERRCPQNIRIVALVRDAVSEFA